MEITQEAIDNHKKAGRILEESRQFGIPLIKEGASYLEVGDSIEAKIKELGGEIAFPCNLSANEIAAHDIPEINDQRVFNSGDVIKLDIGVHVDGYIADSAVTVIIGENEKAKQMYAVNSKALDEALKMFVPGQKISEISQTIEDIIRAEGFKPIANLSGHGLGRYIVHKHPSISNVRTSDTYVLEDGDVCAIEPFVTDGKGMINEHSRCGIFMFTQDKNIRLPEGSKIIQLARDEWHGLPFAERWLTEKGLSPLKLRMAMQQLVNNYAIKDYPVLIEAGKGMVTQKEHNVIVKDKPIVYTRDFE